MADEGAYSDLAKARMAANGYGAQYKNPLYPEAASQPATPLDDPRNALPDFSIKGRGATRRDLAENLWGAAVGAYQKATTPLPQEPNERFKAHFGVDPRLPWPDFFDQTMRNFTTRAAKSIPGVSTGAAAYNALYDPEHPVTQQQQSTKDAAVLAGLAGFEIAAPWISNKLGRALAVPPELSRHPNQRGENFYFSLPALLAAWHGIRPSKP